MDGVQLPQGYSHFEEAVYFFTIQFPEIPGTHFIDLGTEVISLHCNTNLFWEQKNMQNVS